MKSGELSCIKMNAFLKVSLSLNTGKIPKLWQLLELMSS